VLAVDLLGEAGKSAPNRPAWDSPAYAEWLAEVLDALKVDRATLIGMSQGSWTALKFATANPARVERLALMCPGGIVPDRLSFILKVAPLPLMGHRGARSMARLLYGSQPVSDDVVRITEVVMHSFKSRMGVLPIFTDEELRRLTMPVLVLGGDQDALRDHQRIAARLRPLLPHLQVTIIPGAGHALLNTTGHILPFLAEPLPA
jgi:pimeloyl-ACP methyl ester carboxylesterase